MRLPKGYRLLRKGTRIKQGDKFWSSMSRWVTAVIVDIPVGWDECVKEPLVYIRKMNQPKRKK